MSDLISYLRDLLVFKAKPDAVEGDVDPELQKTLAVHAKLIENERLLELIDQFAQAEGRMKWAPNKKLHFEVAIIKAVQSLNQATLDEVIEKLGELRGGSPRDASARPPDKAVAEKKTLGAEKADPASVASPAGNPAGEEAILQPANTVNGGGDVQEIWKRAFAKIPPTKAFVRNSAAVAHVLPSEGRHFVLGFSPDERSPMDILGTPTNRKLIESLLQDVSGKDWSLKLIVSENLPSKAESPKESSENYSDDPLIREALEVFKGQIRS
jgi:DNA polymerase-3 subunit gamma/tau